jgi:hypothetical protein
MSALGHKRTFAVQKRMSALPPKADIPSAERNVCFVPIADIDNPGLMFSIHRKSISIRSLHRRQRVKRAAQ